MNKSGKSKFIVAVLLFSICSALVANFIHSKADAFPFLTWTGWTIKDFLQSPKRANIVFLGSSLVLVPLDGVDADYLGKRIDGSQHHRSSYFEDKFASITHKKINTFNFALPGEMPSDSYLIVKNLLVGKHKPDVIIYGVGPRDFLDNLLQSPSATDPFKYLSRFGNVDSIADRFYVDWQERLNYVLGKQVYLYGHRFEITDQSTNSMNKFIDLLIPSQYRRSVTSFDDKRLMCPDYHPCEVAKGQVWFRPITNEQERIFTNDLAEYKQRYKKLKWETYLSQMQFFVNTLQAAKAQGVITVLAIMPVTDLNRSLIDDISWHAYRDGVLAFAKQTGTYIIDFSNSSQFSRADFGDTVHLHSGGGKRWLDIVIDKLANQPHVLTAIENQPPICIAKRRGVCL